MIKGKNIHLRPILKSDIQLLNEWKNSEETYKYLGGGFSPTSIDEQDKWMDAMIDMSGNNKRFMICKHDGIPVGLIGLYSINWINRNCEIGIYIGNLRTKGQGYGTEASGLIEKFANEYLNLRKIKLNVVADNKQAIHMWTSLNYEQVGVYKDERFIKGEYRDLILMEKFIQ
ncbi:GNAT family protein [Priestia sp. FSL R5-0597]|uniref:GNAT family N-acetyltransferase n=1 Tax=Priestia TaxID=2800373 RepID=UPI0012B756E5|nr:GNAT family protein [Priestia megaterium]